MELKILCSGDIDKWNTLVSIMNNHSDSSVKDRATRLLKHMNTAGGQTMMKEEVLFFIKDIFNIQ